MSMWDLPQGVHEGAAVEWTQGGQQHGMLLWFDLETGWATVEEDSGQLTSVPIDMLRPYATGAQLRLL